MNKAVAVSAAPTFAPARKSLTKTPQGIDGMTPKRLSDLSSSAKRRKSMSPFGGF